MNIVRFKIEGLVNSFRVSQTAVYQNTTIVPTKTQIIGLITNIMGKVEKDYYELLNNLRVGIVPVEINNIFTDLWQYKKWKKSNQGRAVLTREKLFLPVYNVYIGYERGIELVDYLNHPRGIPALAMDDELIKIHNIKKLGSYDELKKRTQRINSVFTQRENMFYIFKQNENYKNHLIIPPRVQSVNLNYDTSQIPRKPINIVNIVEFVGGYCELKNVDIECLYDNEKDLYVELL